MTDEQLLELPFRRQPAIVTRRVAGEVILVPVTGRMAQEGSLYTLNGTSAFLWERLDGRRTGRDLVRDLEESYEVEGPKAESDVQAFLSQLQEIGAIASA
jgi:hypothetical protein